MNHGQHEKAGKDNEGKVLLKKHDTVVLFQLMAKGVQGHHVETQMKGFKVRRGTRKGPPQFTPMDNVAVVFGHGTRCHPVVPVGTKETHLQQQEYGSGGFVPNKGQQIVLVVVVVVNGGPLLFVGVSSKELGRIGCKGPEVGQEGREPRYGCSSSSRGDFGSF